MAKDGRALRQEAAEATAAGKHKRALAAYLELERIEPRDAQWAKRAAETYKRLGNTKNAIDAYERSADRYAQNGFLVQAMAVCKLVLQIDPNHATTLNRLAQMNEQVGAGPSRAQSYADNNPELHTNPNVAMLRRSGSSTGMNLPPAGPPKRLKPTTPPASYVPVAVPRTKSRPIALPPGAPLETVNLAKEFSSSTESSPGVTEIRIDDLDIEADDEITSNAPVVEIEEPGAYDADIDDATELALEDIEEIPLPQPVAMGARAQRALAATPLFAGLPAETLEALVAHLTIVPLAVGAALFHEGDPGDALYVIVEGEVSVSAEGPPLVEMARLGPGAFIGEVALMTEQPRSATVTATEPSELLRIDRHTLSRVLANHGDVLRAVLRFVRERLVDRWMRTSPLFRPFDDEQRNALAARFKFLEIEANTKLLAAGQRPDGLYIVLAGNYSVQRNGALIATVGPGELIGETALLSGGTFRSDVVARGKGLALCLPAADFREVIMTHPHVLEYVGEHAEQSRRLQIL
jgi:cAMP-dependent protein kinase regulator